jgi:lysophospholipase L1-like esterase
LVFEQYHTILMKTRILIKVIIIAVLLLAARSVHAQDWPNLRRYEKDNEKLKDSTVKVVYMGDSITASWFSADSSFFKQHNYVDRGIGGQTSPQMLLRFRQDVIELKPKAVVILCGTNDIAGNTGPMTLSMTEDNIKDMAELAKVNKIKVVLCSVLPADHFNWRKEVQPADSIIELNAWIKAYAKNKHFGYVDYYSALVNDRKGMKTDYSKDGVHPNPAGFAIMEPLVQAAIRKAL